MHLQLFLSAHTGIEVEKSPHCTWLCCRSKDIDFRTSPEHHTGIMTEKNQNRFLKPLLEKGLKLIQ